MVRELFGGDDRCWRYPVSETTPDERRDAAITDILMYLRMLAADDLALSAMVIDTQGKFEGRPVLPPSLTSRRGVVGVKCS